jgi:hypothetical protein
MSKAGTLFVVVQLIIAAAGYCSSVTQAVPFAEKGQLKMLYDNRMRPQAVEHGGQVYLVWRGEKGLSFIRSYDLESRKFSEPVMVLKGLEDKLDLKKYASDHHFAPVLWIDSDEYFHILSGCHGNKPKSYSSGIHIISQKPGDTSKWKLVDEPINISVNYPKAYTIHDGRSLLYFRDKGHLGSWTYRISGDSGKSWEGPARAPVDLDLEPQDGIIADHAGSYHTVKLSADGKRLHAAFIFSQTDYLEHEVPPINPRYNVKLGANSRYNLYYIHVDLLTGKVFNINGKEMETPIRKSVADAECIVWDTDWRVAAYGASIYLDEKEEPYFLLPVSDETPYKGWFYFIKRQNKKWIRSRITRTGHPFNAGHLERNKDGTFRAYMITGDGESYSEEETDRYGWGDAVQIWTSDEQEQNWELTKDITPIKGWKYQNIRPVTRSSRGAISDMITFYGWPETGADGTAFLWDNRK